MQFEFDANDEYSSCRIGPRSVILSTLMQPDEDAYNNLIRKGLSANGEMEH